MTIALLCPTRQRAAQCKRMIQSAKETAEGEIIVYLAHSYEEIKDYSFIHDIASEKCRIAGLPSRDYPTGYKWNKLAEFAMHHRDIKLFMLCADDVIFSTPLWDKALLDHYNALENKIHVYALQDSRDPNGTPHPIVTREYIEAMGYFVPPIFLHWYVDAWTVEIAKANRCFTHMRDYLLVHDKPSDYGAPDETHTRIRELGWHERDLWVETKCRHFLKTERDRLFRAIHSNEAAA